MRYIDSYNQIKELNKELSILRSAYYDYENHLSDEEFYKLRNRIKEIKNKIDFLENIRRANERVRASEQSSKIK